ncbi:GumC family protein [Arenimonas sp.]|uniref:GumC family protein n=1 Tax=Arenimonas sp. TaxID=1872635 RepID=UPI0039E2DA60
MQHNPNDPSGHEPEPESLPTPSAEVRPSALAIARPQQALSLELRSPENTEQDDEINLLDYWRILVKRRWTVIATLAMVLIIALVKTLLTTPIYRSTSIVQIDNDTLRVVKVEGIEPMGYDPNFLETQIGLLNSRALAQRVVKQMGLPQSGELSRLWPASNWQRLTALVRGAPDAEDAATASAAAQAPVKEDPAAVNAIAASFQGGISVSPVGQSRLVRINYDSPDADFSRRAANAIAEAFVANNLDRRFGSATYAKGYLEERLKEMKAKLEESERQLVAFAQKEQIVSAGGENGASLTEQNLGALNSAYATVKAERIRAESRWRQAQSLRGSGLQAAAGEDPMIKTLQESRAKLMLEYQDKLRLYKPGYPLMQQLKAQIDEINQQIVAEEANIRSGIQAEYQAALQQEKMLEAQLSQSKGEVLDVQGRSIQYNIFKREVDTNRQLYDALLQRYKEVGVAGGVSANNIAVVDLAEPGYKVLPDMSRNLTMAAMAGLLLGALLAFGFEYLDDTVKRPEDIEKKLGLPVLGAIPQLKAPMTPMRALEDVRSAFAESYRSLRTALQFSTDHGVPRSLLVTSPVPGEGKSTTALVLAQMYAQLGKRVLVIDCDLRNPSLHRQLGVENSQGLSNYLAGASKPTDMIQPTQTPGLLYMPTGPLPPNPAELLMGPKMVSLLSTASEKFDLVILDGPPVMGLADAPILSNMAQGTLIVVQAGNTRIGLAKNAIKRLHAARARLVGGLLTHFQAQHTGDGYSYGNYYYSYGSPQLTRQ